MIDDIPRDLRDWAHFITWRYENRDEKQTKIPHDAKNGNYASVLDPTTWASFDRAVEALATNAYSGLGWVLTQKAGYTFIDLDIKDTMSQNDLSRMISIQEKFDSYSERSPGGKGLHIICKGTVPRGRKRSGIEIYSDKRFMTLTGDVYDRKPIAERQDLLNVLWSELGVGTPIYGSTDCPQTLEDGEVLNRAAHAANADKFLALYKGEWQGTYPSQSEADFALVDIISFYSQNREQIHRLFKGSELGHRDKASRIDYMDMMVNRSFDRMLPPVNTDSIRKLMDDVLTAQEHSYSSGTNGVMNGAAPVGEGRGDGKAPPFDGASVRKPNGHLNEIVSDVKFPPGLMGEIANFIYQSSPRPVAEISLCAAIGLLAGMCGRAYNTPTGAGLNLYLLMIALSGTGKEGMASGISRLIDSCSKLSPGATKVPAIKEFIGPSEFRSDASLIKAVERTPSMVSIQGEFGLKLKTMHAQHAASHLAGLKTIYLDIYTKSGKGNICRPIVYSDSAKNTHEIIAPAFSILAESTPSSFYDTIDEAMIAHGLLPRFLIMEYMGKRVRSNHSHNSVEPTPTLQRDLNALANHCLTMTNEGRELIVLWQDESVFKLADEFDVYCDDQVNAHTNEVIRDLWNRGHLKSLKLASLVSVGIDSFRPLITADAWRWAQELVQKDIERMVERFEHGEVGTQENSEKKQADALIAAMLEFLKRPWSEISKYKAGEPVMQKYRLIPHSFIVRRLTSSTQFKLERMGATYAINRTLKSLTESGIIRDVTNSLSPDTKATLSYGGKLYVITDMRYLQSEE